MREDFTYPSSDGKNMIHGIRWTPEDKPIAVLQIVHGMVEFIARYEDFAEYLTQQGFAVVGEDHLGHGESAMSEEDLGYFGKGGNGFLMEDIHQLRKMTTEQWPDIPYFMLGHSMGSFLLRQYLVEGEIPVFSDSVSTNQVLISKALATKMKLKLGDKIYTYYIQDDIRARRLTNAGIYQTNFSEYDNLFLLTDLNLVNRLNGWQPEQVTGVELQVKDYDRLEDITYEIATDIDNRQDELGGVYYVRNIEQLNPQIFAWLD
ncbi:MAG: alpha/beta hydrolase, partial [Clostridia bacterium]|nr:alpha/beta hydrolase [Clostridia bacterium]